MGVPASVRLRDGQTVWSCGVLELPGTRRKENATSRDMSGLICRIIHALLREDKS